MKSNPMLGWPDQSNAWLSEVQLPYERSHNKWNMIGNIIHHHNEEIRSTKLETIMNAWVTPDATPVHVSTCDSHFSGSSAFRFPWHLSLSFSSPDSMDCVHKSVFMLCFKKDSLLSPTHTHNTHLVWHMNTWGGKIKGANILRVVALTSCQTCLGGHAEGFHISVSERTGKQCSPSHVLSPTRQIWILYSWLSNLSLQPSLLDWNLQLPTFASMHEAQRETVKTVPIWYTHRHPRYVFCAAVDWKNRICVRISTHTVSQHFHLLFKDSHRLFVIHQRPCPL